MSTSRTIEHHLLQDPSTDLRAACGAPPGRRDGDWRWHSVHDTATFIRCLEFELRCCTRCASAAFEEHAPPVVETRQAAATTRPTTNNRDSETPTAQGTGLGAHLRSPRHQVTEATVLGSLVDRAVSMPFTLPQVLRKGHRRMLIEGKWTTCASIAEDVGTAARLLKESLMTLAASSASRTSALVDPAAPWRATNGVGFHELLNGEQDAIVDKLVPTALKIATHLERKAVDEKWAWLWSQPTLFKPGSMLPATTRPDLVAGLDWKRCLIVDLKTTKQREFNSALRHKAQLEVFTTWAEHLRQLRFNPISAEVLVASTVDSNCQWFDFSAACVTSADG